MKTSERGANPQIEFRASVDGVADELIGPAQILDGSADRRARYLGELSPIDVDVAFDVLAHVNYLVADVFALSIAIGPNDELLARAHLALKCSLDLFVVGRTILGNGRVKQLNGLTRAPIPELVVEIERQQMAGHRGHHHDTLSAEQLILELVDLVEFAEAISLFIDLNKH